MAKPSKYKVVIERRSLQVSEGRHAKLLELANTGQCSVKVLTHYALGLLFARLDGKQHFRLPEWAYDEELRP